MKKIIYFFFLSVLLAGCSSEPVEDLDLQNISITGNAIAQKGNPHNQFGTPSVSPGTATENSLEVMITAGERGATGGLSVRWMTLEDYETYGWNNGLGGHVLLNGKSDAAYSLEEGEEFWFPLEDHVSGEGDSWNRALECGQTYVFIVQAHQDGSTQKSDYSDPVEVSTTSCEVDDPCDLLSQNVYSDEFTQEYVLEYINGEAFNLSGLWLGLLEEGDLRTGKFDTDIILDLYADYQVQRQSKVNPIELTYPYTVTDGECTDSADLTLVISW